MATEQAGRDSPGSRLPPVLKEAVAAHQAGQLDAAVPLYREFLSASPEHPTALQLLGLLHSQRGEYDSAIALMQDSLRLFPDQAEVANNLGNALSARGRTDEALESYANAVELQPRYTDAWRNMGLTLMGLERFEDAGKCFRKCTEIEPGDAAAWLALGNVYRRLDRLDLAITSYEKALALRPDYAEAHHNLGVALRIRRQPAAALEHLESAKRLGLDRAELYHNMGSALVDQQDITGAIDAYRAAIRRNPADITSHQNLNTLLWEQELLSEHLESYREALKKHPKSIPLRRAYAIALNQVEAYEEAEKVLADALRIAPDEVYLKTLLAFAQEGQQNWKMAVRTHADAVASPGSIPDQRTSYARALLACGRPDEALREAREAARLIPANQRALAYLGLCWRVLGDERDDVLNNYEDMVRVYDVPVPSRFANAGEFNGQLIEVLDSLHTGKRHPPEQTLRGGTQTHGDLFDRHEPEIGELVDGLRQCIDDYLSRMPESPEHPMFSRRGPGFDFAASWSVRLNSCGYHTMHIHPLGWISSAYYVQVPPEVVGSKSDKGGIKFGEPDIDLGEHGAARRLIQPAIGRLVLFPSYMWHGTIPFESDDPRTTVAFDVVPGPRTARP